MAKVIDTHDTCDWCGFVNTRNGTHDNLPGTWSELSVTGHRFMHLDLCQQCSDRLAALILTKDAAEAVPA